MIKQGVPLLNQAVLLRGINDRAETLCELSRQLVNRRIMPYYLHRLDRVQGAEHFDSPPGLGQRLIQQLRESLPGYAVPRFAWEVPGELSKIILA
jgi:L-lysine 2,3-aminomutase